MLRDITLCYFMLFNALPWNEPARMSKISLMIHGTQLRRSRKDIRMTNLYLYHEDIEQLFLSLIEHWGHWQQVIITHINSRYLWSVKSLLISEKIGFRPSANILFTNIVYHATTNMQLSAKKTVVRFEILLDIHDFFHVRADLSVLPCKISPFWM